MKTVQARLDSQSERLLVELERRLGWTPSRAVREGLKLLASVHQPLARHRIHGLGKFDSGLTDLGSNKDHLRRFRALRPILLDTGVIVALLDRREKYHRACVAAVESLESPLITCEPVIAEACYLVRNIAGAKQAVLQNVAAGIFHVPFLLRERAGAVKRILDKYDDMEIDLADACLIDLASSLKVPDVLTLDADFQTYRWSGDRRFRMVVNF
jgi:uncharacterized protein